jgi:hypothetical protein
MVSSPFLVANSVDGELPAPAVPRTLTWINLGFLFVVTLAIVQLYFILSPRLRVPGGSNAAVQTTNAPALCSPGGAYGWVRPAYGHAHHRRVLR